MDTNINIPRKYIITINSTCTVHELKSCTIFQISCKKQKKFLKVARMVLTCTISIINNKYRFKALLKKSDSVSITERFDVCY
jgi:hypothetical protein